MDEQESKTVFVVESRPQHSSKTQSAISTKLFLALGIITLTAIVAGTTSIIALTRFQNNFDSLINRELPTLEDTRHISQLSVTLANRGAGLIVSADNWTRENIMGQVGDDAQWLEEILTRVSNENLPNNRKHELLDLNKALFTTYVTLNTLTENRIIYTERLEDIDKETSQIQQDIMSVRYSTNLADGTVTNSGPLLQWNEAVHTITFNLSEARRIKHPSPLNRLQVKTTRTLAEIGRQLSYLPDEALIDAKDVYERLKDITSSKRGIFAIKKADLKAETQTTAMLRHARTLAEQFMSASELATADVRKSIDATNQETSHAMDLTLKATVGFTLISIFVALMAFLYLNRTVLRRFINLRRSMVAHAEGDDVIIDTTGHDEITDMARSLQYLVDTLHSREVGLTLAKEEAEHASTAKTRFLAAASHDLRQPLQALSLFVYALEGKEKDIEKREIIGLIRNSLDALKELLNTLLDISKLEAGVVQPTMKHFAAGPMIERIKSELTAVAWANDLSLKTVSSTAMVHSDPSLLETTIRNLVDNAIKYTEQGRVLVGCRRRGDWVRFEIWDTGPGIPNDQREAIFQDFYQIDNEARKRVQGLGLGLSIVKRMADILGCVIGCDSQLGKGSVFWVEVPAAPHVEAISTPAPLLVEPLPAGAGHIAIIEDDEHVLMGLKSLLEVQGYSTITFQEANRPHLEKVFAVKQRIPDLIVADYRLEGNVTGSEAIQNIRELLDKDIPAIIITGDTAPERLREAKKSGFPILHKPVQPEELIIAIRDAVLGAQDNRSQSPVAK